MKKVLCAALVMLLIFALVACGSSGSGSTSNSWKNKSYNSLNGDEKSKANDYIGEVVDNAKSKGIEL